ncbi:MAG: hypothetical protein JWR66_1080 [Modestobacter sp.]|nr:hypothetical protein [Modestobacter sp.]
MPEPFPPEFRRDVIAVARKGEASISQVARDFGISESCLQRWLKIADRDDGLATGWINLVAALAFIAFGFWTLRGDNLTEEEKEKASRAVKSVVIAVGTAFFLAELGDKTMLATITLATDYGWFGTWVGSTLGMVAADALAIVVGRALGKRLPENVIRIGAAVLFFIFGVVLIVEAIAQLT